MARDWESEWRGLEPEQPHSGRCGCWLGAAALLLIITSVCLGTAYFAWQQLALTIGSGPSSLLPTIPPLVSPEPIDSVDIAAPSENASATRMSLAPTVTIAGNEAAVSSADIEALFAVDAPRIDGNLDDWADTTRTESLYRVYNVAEWDRTDDVRASWRLTWDRENLYVAVDVEDDTHVQVEQGNAIFRGDGISLQIDTQRADASDQQLSADDFQINLSPGDFAGNPAAAYRFRGDSSGSIVDFTGHSVQVAAVRTPGGYILEAAIPWGDLEVVPEGGLLLGIALNVNDNDTPGTAVQEVMMSNVATRKFSDPTSWGTITLR